MIPKGTLSVQHQSDLTHGTNNPYWAKRFNAGETVHFVIVRSKRPFRTQHGTTLLLSDGVDGRMGWEYRCDKFAEAMNQFNIFPTLGEALASEIELNEREAEYAETTVQNLRNQIVRLQKLSQSCQAVTSLPQPKP